MLIGPLTQLPVFVSTSLMLSHASQPPTVLDSESFFTLSSLAHSDPTLTLPIVLGILTLANVESSRWFISTAALEREQKVAEWNTKKRAMGHTVIEPKKIVQSTLRVLAVARILIAALVPGSIQLYWVTSAAFGLVQTWIIDWIDHGRRKFRALQAPEPAKPVARKEPASTIVFKKVKTESKLPKPKRK
ncbi:hypothetical protein EW026_g141 [Hermanssonia centrifuga]|uniref:Uncharacterized protein n=1 Tax=Hermanssonia centrifuga TaxID=98765 RepID=A0A4S4KVY1_9APHY|nr:hypothetical protein EW026_g141 [Hermanssonia centrifuga]